MMQQVATKGSEIAALPIELDNAAAAGAQETGKGQFNDVFRQASASGQQTADGGKKWDHRPASRQPVAQEAAQPQSDRATSETTNRKPEIAAAAPEAEQNNKSLHDRAQNGLSCTEAHADVVSDDPKAGEETDWLALVESVRKLHEQDSESENTEVLNDDAASEGDDFLTLLASFGPDELPQEWAQLANADGTVNNRSQLDFPLDEQTQSLLAGLLSASGESSMDEQQQALLSEAAQQLLAGQSGQGSADTLPEPLQKLLTQLMSQAADAKESADESGSAEGIDSTSQQGSSKSQSDAELLLDLLQAQLAGESNSDVQMNAKSDASKTPELPAVTVDGDKVDDISLTLQQFNGPAKALATEALADNIVAALPAITDQQQASVKGAIVAGVQEIQSQLAQGQEPALNLQDLIAQALQEAGINPDTQVVEQMDQQLSQFQSVLSTAQQASTHALHSLNQVSPDMTIQENTQLRSESSKAQAHTDGLDKPVNIFNPDGQQQLSDKIRWMVNSRNTMAEIRLDPPEMGSMQIRVNVSGDTASVNIVVQNAAARDALADTVPRLREMLAEQGIQLGESSVQQQQQGNEGESGERQFAGQQQGDDTGLAEENVAVTEQSLSRRALGGIDDYA